jgi:hypothetical protein
MGSLTKFAEQTTGTSNPFAGAQKTAARKVEKAARALPKAPTPSIPRLAKPTPAQTHAALTIAAESQAKAVGPNPTVAKVKAYQQQLASDPRQRAYRETLEHFVRAQQGHERELLGRVVAGGGGNAQAALAPAARALSSQQARAIGKRAEQVTAGTHQSAGAAPAPKGLSVPLLGTIVPGRTLQGASRVVGSKLAEDLPPLIATGKAIGELATGSVAGGPTGNVLHNAVADLAQLPAGTISSLAETARGGAEALGGKPGRIETIGKGLAASFEHPLRSLEQHPVSTALTFAGGEEAAGRLAGAVARTGAVGERAAEVASTARPNLKLYNDMAEKRVYNPDPVRKGVEVATDKVRQKLPGSLKQPDPNQAVGARLTKAIKGGVLKSGEVDVSVDAGEQARRNLKGQVVHEVQAAKPKVGAEAVPLIVEGVVRSPETMAADLAKEHDRLMAVQPSLVGRELGANKDNVAQIEKLQADKRLMADPADAFASAKHFNAMQAPLTAGLERVGHLSPEQARAALFPYAQAHEGARYFTVADHQAAESAARAGEVEAKAAIAKTEPNTPERAQAVRAFQEARGHRLAVSGRGAPENIAAHEDLQQAAAARRAAVSEARGEVSKAEHARSRLVGTQRSRRASDGMRGASAEESARMEAANARVQGAKDRLRSASLEHAQARDAAQASKLPKIQAGMRHANGEYFPTEEIRARAAAAGVDPGFLSHQETLGDRGSFFKPTTRRPAIASKVRTGESFVKGTYDRSHAALVAQAAKMANEYAAHHATDARLSRFGIGHYDSLEEAAHEAENFSHTPEGERIVNSLGPLEAHPIGPERVRATGRVVAGDSAQAREGFGIEQHQQVSETPGGKYTLLPKAVSERLKEHDALMTSSAGKKILQKYTNQWRQAALYTSPRWLLGNPQEHAIRLAIAGAAPKALGGRSGRFAQRLVDAYDEIGRSGSPEAEAARQTLASLVRGTHYSAAEQLSLVRKADQFASSPLLGPAAAQTEHVAGSVAGQAVLAPWRAWKDVIGKGMTKLEQESRKAALGKVATQDIQRFHGKWVNVMKLTDDAVRQYAKGTLKPAEAAYLVKRTDEMMGAWGHLTPTVRGAVQTVSPFGLWWLTSMRFLSRMPIDHPTKTAIIAALHNATAANQAEQPSYLQGGIHVHLPLGLGGATLTPTYYSPAGVGVEPVKTLVDTAIPQFGEALAAGSGVSLFTGDALTAKGPGGQTVKPTQAQRGEIGLNDVLTGLIPGLRQIQQLRQQGGKTFSTGNALNPEVKPGTQRSLEQTLFKILSPERFVYDSKSAATGSPDLSGLSSGQRERVQRALANQAGSAADPIREQRIKEALARASSR